ncbi:hypothetical protein IAT38_005143 [Cryptococcus sp. DSM 104549]
MRTLSTHPFFRPLLALAFLLLTMHALKAQWHRLAPGKGRVPSGSAGSTEDIEGGGVVGEVEAGERPRLVVAHFMLGNTYPFTEEDWLATFDLARDTNLDALALNLGPEEWQLSQARTAYSLLASNPPPAHHRPLKLFLSLDMNVLPHSPPSLITTVLNILASGPEVQLRWGGGVVLSTFGGHGLGDEGWREVISGVEAGLEEKVFFWPAFFLPPHEILTKDYVDGAFAWNNAWPMGNHPTSLDEDKPFLESDKAYMAAVSPLFFTHYGTEGEWAWNKNWIYRSDDLLLPTRFTQLLSLPPSSPNTPDIIQIISFNDYGESHSIAPVRGAQPGSEAWTEGMGHEGFRWLVRWYAGRWRDGRADGDGEEDVRVVMWYRTHPKDMVTEDKVGRPDHAYWAQDLINFFILPPSGQENKYSYTLHVQNGPATHTRHLNPTTAGIEPGEPFLLTVPFVTGEVEFEVRRVGEKGEGKGEVVCKGEGREIRGDGREYNFNMWSGVF